MVILPVADGSVLLPTEVLDVFTVVDPPGIVVVLGTCDAVGVIEAVVVTVKTMEKHNKNYIFVQFIENKMKMKMKNQHQSIVLNENLCL